MDTQELDQKIARIQRSTRASFASFIPLHNRLRMKYSWYYKWHIWRGASITQIMFLIFYVSLVVSLVAQNFVSLSETTFASPKTWNFSNSSEYSYDNSKIEFSSGQARLKAPSNWYSTAWTRRKVVTVTGSTDGAQTNFQLKITIPYATGMKTDFSDIRFASSDGTTLIDHWLESKTDSSTADIWVKIPSIPASPATTTIYLYYGNSSAASASSGLNTFDYFGDYEQSAPVLRFAVASDLHYGQSGTDYVTNAQNAISWLNGEKNANGLDYTFFNGDNEMEDPSLLATVKGYYDSLSMPYRVIYGNHDHATTEQWQSTWGYSENNDFSSGDYAFIFANTSDAAGDYLCADSTWLNGRLDYYANKKYVFVFMHITPSAWTTYGIDCPAVRSAIESHTNVGAVFNGHDHQEDGTKFLTNTNYAFDGHFGGSYGVGYMGYRIVEVYADGEIYSYQYNPATATKVNENRLEFSKGYPNITEVISNSTDVHKIGSQSLKLSGPDLSYAVFVKKPIPEGKYVIESWVQSTIAGLYQAAGVGLINMTAADPSLGKRTGNYVQNFLYYSENKIYTDLTIDSAWDRMSYSYPMSGSTWYKSKIILDGTNASFYDPAGGLLRTTAYTPSKLFPAFPEMRHEGPAICYYDQYIIRKYANPDPTYSIGSESFIYDTSAPTVMPLASGAQAFTSLFGFSETATKNGGEIKYQISNDAGTSWYWYSSGWMATTEGFAESNTASDVNANISSFPRGSGSFIFRAYLSSDGTQSVQLDSVNLAYSTVMVSNVTALQDSNGKVNVSYDLLDSTQGTATVSFQHYDGLNWQNCQTINGDGTVAIGNGQTAAWIAKTDFSNHFLSAMKIRVIASDGTSTASADSSSFLLDTKNPTGLSLFSGQMLSTTSVKLTWQPATDDTFLFYRIWYKKSPQVTGGGAMENKWDSANDPQLSDMATGSTTISDLDAGNTYYFKIWAYDQKGNVSSSGETSVDLSNGEIVGYIVPPEDNQNIPENSSLVGEIKKIIQSDTAQKVQVPAAIAAIISTIGVIAAPIAANAPLASPIAAIWSYLSNLFAPFSVLAVAKKNKKYWGIVYDSETLKPVSKALVRLFGRESRELLEMQMTDAHGRYAFLVSEGIYSLEVSKKDYIFPSRLRPDKYQGKEITIDASKMISLDIPLDPDVQKLAKKILVFSYIGKAFSAIRLILLIIGTILITFLYIYKPDAVNLIIILVYLILWFTVYLEAEGGREYGKIVDALDRSPLDLSIVRLYKSDGRLIQTKVTDKQGKYFFLLGKGDWAISAIRQNYNLQRKQLHTREGEIYNQDFYLDRMDIQ